MNRYFLINGEKATDLGLRESKPVLPANKGTVYEAVFASMPVPLSTQKVVESWEIVEDKYVQSFEVVDKTPLEMWHHPEWAMKLTAPTQLVFDDDGAKFFNWFKLMDFPMVRKGATVEVYFNEVLPDHEAFVEQLKLQGVITVENRPTE